MVTLTLIRVRRSFNSLAHEQTNFRPTVLILTLAGEARLVSETGVFATLTNNPELPHSGGADQEVGRQCWYRETASRR